MSDVVISVRGEAEAVVAPDVALLNCRAHQRRQQGGGARRRRRVA